MLAGERAPSGEARGAPDAICVVADATNLPRNLAFVGEMMAQRLPMVVVVFDDQEIGLIRVKQEIKGLEPYGIGLGGIDWEKLAQGVGADGITVDSEAGLADALTTAVKADRPVVIGARIDKSGYVAQFNALREL